LAKMWKKEQNVADVEWDGLKPSKGLDGPKTQAEMDQLHEAEDRLKAADDLARPSLEPEPLFTVEQIGELEQKIGAGLLEEVIQVAEGELKLAGIMVQNRIWEDLTEKSPEGQWAYFERRDAHTDSQKPPV